MRVLSIVSALITMIICFLLPKANVSSVGVEPVSIFQRKVTKGFFEMVIEICFKILLNNLIPKVQILLLQI